MGRMAEGTHTFLVLFKLTARGVEQFSADPKGFAEKVKSKIEEGGVKVVEYCALLGDYDGAMKIEAENEKVLAKALVKAAADGLFHTTTYTSINVDEL
ncbi:hypothetical protein IPA_08350 [Ignicoccus pacificus DSM 13166]|uniref:GYD domain-containing protein n=1 Tax=Ignicoccus pacificus DSM 13166 TaxID=940294 RepID=A0A977PKF6_9CREN|nr:hypothetical protein IPA_08350 [Ignicoccus pacificus DSM 13166]